MGSVVKLGVTENAFGCFLKIYFLNFVHVCGAGEMCTRV